MILRFFFVTWSFFPLNCTSRHRKNGQFVPQFLVCVTIHTCMLNPTSTFVIILLSYSNYKILTNTYIDQVKPSIMMSQKLSQLSHITYNNWVSCHVICHITQFKINKWYILYIFFLIYFFTVVLILDNLKNSFS